MAYVVVATLRARSGREETVAEAIRMMTRHSREEPGCLLFQAQRSLEDPTVFLAYEQYADAAAFEAHQATPHYERYVKGQIAPNLAGRERGVYETFE